MDISAATASLDIKSLRTLSILLTECSVTRTAERLHQPQPSISLTLRRLRDIFRDPLLVREGNRLTVTRRGAELQVVLARLLGELELAVNPGTGFDPRQGRHHFRLVLGNCFGVSFLPAILGRLRTEAPDSVVDVGAHPSLEQISNFMTAGLLDIALGNWPTPPPSLRRAPLFSSEFVCLVHEQHPLAGQGRLTLEEFIAVRHISLSSTADPAVNPVDARLAQLGLERRVTASVAEYGSIPHVLAQTDLCFTTSRHFGQRLTEHMPLRMLEAPASFGTMEFYMLWQERNHRSEAHLWLRNLIRDVARAEIGDSARAPLALAA
jgi:DNA-binding transcriptional LysR family regulator